MYRILPLLLICVLLLSLTACVPKESTTTSPATDPSGSSNATDPPVTTQCQHQMTVFEQIDATCTGSGIVQSCCKLCGEVSIRHLPPLGHNYIDGECTQCGDKHPSEKPGSCEHAYEVISQLNASCTNSGLKSYRCKLCADQYQEMIKPLGHSYADGKCTRCGEADPSIPTEITYTVKIRTDKGVLLEGITVSIYTTDDTPAAVGTTDSTGVATMTLAPAESYRLVLDNVPASYIAKESYTFRSNRANINLVSRSVTSSTDHSNGNYKVGSTMGEFSLTDTDGNTYTLSTLLQEKDLVILNFWFVNCGPCKAEFPYFEAINKEYTNVQLLTLNHIDSEAQIKTLRAQMGVTFPMIAENIGFQQGFDIIAYPTTVFIDSSGKILKIKVGDFKSQTELEDMIAMFLK